MRGHQSSRQAVSDKIVFLSVIAIAVIIVVYVEFGHEATLRSGLAQSGGTSTAAPTSATALPTGVGDPPSDGFNGTYSPPTMVTPQLTPNPTPTF